MINKITNLYYRTIYELESWNWTMILLGIISIQLTILLFVTLNNRSSEPEFTKNSLELILTINGLFSAILVTYFFNRISWILTINKETHEEAIVFSQKITEFRRILKKLTDFYGVWEDDNATKSLLGQKAYKRIDYYDLKMLSISDYQPEEKEAIEKLQKDERYKESQTGLYLGMISLVYDRKSDNIRPGDELYKDYQVKGRYNFEHVQKWVEVDYASRLGYAFQKDYQFIHYGRLSKKSQKYILDACIRINPKYADYELDNKLMSEICDDMNEHYFKELYQLLLDLRKGLSGINLIIFVILISSLVFGVLFPFFTYFMIQDLELKKSLSNLLIGINFGLLFFFVTNLYGIIKKEIIWK